MTWELITVPPERLAHRSATWLGGRILAACAERGECHLAVSGGRTPLATFEELAAEHQLPWGSLHIWQVDERVAPDGDPDRNAVGLRRTLLDRVAIPPDQVHLMDVTADDLESAARAYHDELESVCRGVLDVVHLGLGPDGHTASWPPGDPVIDVTGTNVAISEPYQGRVRMTLTPEAVNFGRERFLLVGGADKRDALAHVLAADGAVPACRISSFGGVIMCDTDAHHLDDRP